MMLSEIIPHMDLKKEVTFLGSLVVSPSLGVSQMLEHAVVLSVTCNRMIRSVQYRPCGSWGLDSNRYLLLLNQILLFFY